jgi:hypothetical protein
MAKFTGIAHLPHRPGPEGLLYGGSHHIRWVLSESYVHRLRTSDTLHKKPGRIGPWLRGTSENAHKAKFAEFHFQALR